MAVWVIPARLRILGKRVRNASCELQEVLINIDELETTKHAVSQSTAFDTRIQAALRWKNWKLLTGDPGYNLWVPPPQEDYSLCKALGIVESFILLLEYQFTGYTLTVRLVLDWC